MKELSQVNSILPFVEVPLGIGKHRALRSLEERVTEAIRYDVQRIVMEGLAKINSILLVETLRQLHQSTQNLPDSITKSNLKQQLRLLILAIQNRFEQISSSEALMMELEQITHNIGSVPKLNAEVHLPSQEFLPRNFEKTVKAWERIVWKCPSRESRTERLAFFSQRGEDYRTASVRLHLISLDKDTQKQEEALSYAEADFYHIGNLQADHLQPSENIVKRQMELVDAMNIDPIFKEQMVHEAGGKGYFQESMGVIYGTKRFYMEYHNCVGNLWLISTAAGTKKGNIDPVEWLNGHNRFGVAFFDSIGGEQTLRRDKILITTDCGELLAGSARQWFHEKYGEEITAAGYICHQVKMPFIERVVDGRQRSKRKRAQTMANLTVAAELAKNSSDSVSDDSSV